VQQETYDEASLLGKSEKSKNNKARGLAGIKANAEISLGSNGKR